ncbi:MAG TPA: SCO family protein [Novosphingobium sp.]|nr:SCO family protein [Novosphingobium sp.]
MNRRAMIKPRNLLASLFLPLALAACNSAAPPVERPPLEGAAIGGPFTLMDKDGKPVSWSDFAGQYRIVYFGYAFCPDVCPLDVQVAMQGLKTFEKAQPELGRKIQPIFITIDPARDTPETVGEFAAAFHPRLIGLTGTPEQIEAAAKAFGAFYARGTDTPGGYLMDHSRVTYLMGPKGEPISMLPVDKDGAAVSAELAKWVK